MSSTILVTGAAGGGMGATGNRLTRKLLEKGLAVRAFVHRDDERSRQLAALGAEVAVGDLLDIHSVRKWMKGIESVYFCYQVKAGLLEATAIMAEAAKEESVKFVLNLSQGSASDESPSPTGRRHWLSEKIFNWSGAPVCHLRGSVFYENLFRQFRKGIEENSELRAPFGTGDAKVPAIAAQDIAQLAFVALQNPQLFIGKTLVVFGAVFSLNELARELTALLGRPIRYREVTPEAWIAEAEIREGKRNPEQIGHLVNLWKHIFQVNQSPAISARLPELSGVYQKLTGASPLSLAQWVKLNPVGLEAGVSR
jgi:uncharacterized protein YbjT (DUF2867 family)